MFQMYQVTFFHWRATMWNNLNNLMNATVFGLIAFVLVFVALDFDIVGLVKNAEPSILIGGFIVTIGAAFATSELVSHCKSRIK
jgi:hypothetical protein